MNTTDYIKEFRKKFRNPNTFDSSSQFNPALAGRLYPELEQWLSSTLSLAAKEAYRDGQKEAHDGLRAAFASLQTPTVLYCKNNKLMQLNLITFLEDLDASPSTDTKQEEKKTHRAYCTVCNVSIDADTGERSKPHA